MIIDAFCFRNEWDCLDIRLHELSPYVDYFVLVEGSLTFQGNPKPWLFDEVKERYESRFPIRHVRVASPKFSDPWQAEAFQRNMIIKGLDDADPDDVVLIGDADEIPRGDRIHEAAAMLELGNDQVGFSQELCFYHVNAPCTISRWDGTQACRVNYAFELGPERIRRQRIIGDALVMDGGAHWSNLGDADWIAEKIESFSHTEVNVPEFKDPDMLARCIAEHREVTGRDDLRFEVRDPDEIWLPQYLRDNREHYAHLFAPVKVAA